jgi:hypothetical protein
MSKPLKYEERYCLFLDILGFNEVVERSAHPDAIAARNGHPVSGVYFSLKQIASSLNYKAAVVGANGKMKASSRVVTQFSDSVVVSYRATENGGLADMLYDVLHLQLALIQRGLLIRGAITKGLLHHDQDFVFGPALNEAVELEKVAMYPRVIVDRDLLKDAGISIASVKKSSEYSERSVGSLVACDLDGMFYVDYFAVHPEDFGDEWGDLCEYLISLREIVKGLSQKRQPSLKLKHSWLRQKFNDVAVGVEQSKFRRFGPHRIPEEEEDHFWSVRPFK